jgi:hypothetical protein
MAGKSSKGKSSTKNAKPDYQSKQRRTLQIVVVIFTIILILSFVLSLIKV